LLAWAPSVVHGLLQTEDYASELLATLPDVALDVITARTRGNGFYPHADVR
jgi:hypothetical protein